ncbi:MAG: sulfite exporter TauE/SafE family protein [Bacteroidetes bacterium]|nr:sulfite exporter TauE/SafE family protein [Bacteroidota bacterium]
MIFYFSAFLIGLAGSVHCVGMCGPLALAIPGASKDKGFTFFLRTIAYQISRISGYGVLGLIVGFFSQGMQFTGVQPYFSLLSGILLLFLGFFGIIPEVNAFSKYPIIQHFQVKINRIIGTVMTNEHFSTPFVLGFLNAMLPCGMIYIALGTGLSSGNMSEAALYLISFGLGTLPLMFMVSISGQFLSLQMRRSWQKAIPIIFMISGIILIYKGMNIDLPVDYNFWEWGLASQCETGGR